MLRAMNDPFALDDDPPLLPERSQPVTGPWLEGLNPEQFQAVTITDGPVLVLSGAGTGKTKVLTSRLAHILASHKAQPWACLAVTFTNRAAREMRERVGQLIGPVADGIWLGTFHSIAVRILRRHCELVGLSSNFTILDSDDQVRLLKQIMVEENIDWRKWPPQAAMGAIQRWKDRGLGPDKLAGEPAGEFASGRLKDLYKLYQERLKLLNTCDFGDLLLHCLTLFLTKPEILDEYQTRFKYILVDEYQDTNVSQYLWLRLLAQKHRNICVVGDDDQCVYSWRGAEVGNILRFESDFPGATVVRLERNYRSTPTILAAASSLISHNQGRLGKTLRPGTDSGQGDPIQVRSVWDGDEEARLVASDIDSAWRAGEKLSTMAILVRAGFQTREFEERLISMGIPYKVIGGPRFYERAEIRDAMAYLRLVVSPDDGLAFERVINLPKRGLGDAAVQAVHVLSRARSLSLFEAARLLIETDELKPKPRQAMAGFIADIMRWRDQMETVPHGELTALILNESGYLDMWKKEKTPDAAGRVENLNELVPAIEEFESLQSFLEHVALVMENDVKAEGDRVVVMTLHGAKGLEFDTVFLPGWEEGVFPHARALDESGAKGLEEERRLAYVGLTRAKKRVFISFAANRRIYNQWQNNLPSRFVDELPLDNVERQANKGLYAGGGYSAKQAPKPQNLWDAVKRESPAGGFKVGERVFHQKFGNGSVTEVDGDKLEVLFDRAGSKKLLDSFVEKSG
jgi:DNA helicase-2/ATP-dependent DNA helicase PcrA